MTFRLFYARSKKIRSENSHGRVARLIHILLTERRRVYLFEVMQLLKTRRAC